MDWFLGIMLLVCLFFLFLYFLAGFVSCFIWIPPIVQKFVKIIQKFVNFFKGGKKKEDD